LFESGASIDEGGMRALDLERRLQPMTVWQALNR
jgi:hypothetical protein